jgi:hypothetical protein
MSTINRKSGITVKRVVVVAVALAMCLTIMPGFKTEARANDGAAFLGGIVAGHVVGGAVRRSERRTEAAEYQAYSQPAPAASAPAAAPATAQQKLDQLNSLAAGGYISSDEYKAKKKAILDGM